MTIQPGTVFGLLTVEQVVKGRKHVAPSAICRCACGRIRRVRPSHLRKGRATACKSCSLKAAWRLRPRTDQRERYLLAKESEYRCNARQRGLAFDLTRQQFRRAFSDACSYCGTGPANGIDRIDSAQGYIDGNSTPCCAECNYAKRSLSHDQFLMLVARIYRHSVAIGVFA